MDYNYFHVQWQSASAAPDDAPRSPLALPQLPPRAVVTIPPNLKCRIQSLTNTLETLSTLSDPAIANACRHAADERLREVQGLINSCRVNNQLFQQFDALSYTYIKLLLEQLFRVCGEIWGEPMQTSYRQRYGYLIGQQGISILWYRKIIFSLRDLDLESHYRVFTVKFNNQGICWERP